MSNQLRISAAALIATLGVLGCSDKGGDGTNTGGTGATAGTGDGGSGGMPNNCDGRGDAFVAGIEKTSMDGTLKLAINSASPAPPEALVDNTWEIKASDGSGNPLIGATFTVRPVMVDHGHGSPKAVVPTDHQDGTYTLTPVYFHMSGYWETTITVLPAGASAGASVTFGFCMPN